MKIYFDKIRDSVLSYCPNICQEIVHEALVRLFPLMLRGLFADRCYPCHMIGCISLYRKPFISYKSVPHFDAHLNTAEFFEGNFP